MSEYRVYRNVNNLLQKGTTINREGLSPLVFDQQ